MIILDYKGEEIRLEGDNIITVDGHTRALAEAAVAHFKMARDYVFFYPKEPESIASTAIQRYMDDVRVVKMVYKGEGWSDTDEPPKGRIF
jgi:hypothetical protein